MFRLLSRFPISKINTPLRFFSTEAKSLTPHAGAAHPPNSIQYYNEGQLVTRSSIVLKKEEDINGYVLSIVKNYFRTTNKSGLNLESTLADHGLDSLDSIELSMQIEDDLGYVISAETLPVLQKVKHYVNYIKHIEQFKQEFKKNPLS